MTGLRNFKKKIIEIFLVSLVFTIVFIKYTEYYKTLNFSVTQPDLTKKHLQYLGEEMNLTVKLTEKLKPKTYSKDFYDKFKGIKHSIPHHNVIFDSVFTKLSDIKPSTMNTFFIESTCAAGNMAEKHNTTGDFILNARQCCSIESAARTNPKRTIYILHTCFVSDDFLLRAPKYVQKLLLNHVNVRVVRYNMTEVFFGTPVQELWQSGRMKDSKYPVEHSSDVLRLLLLWKFGGMYCDLDVITLRPVDELHTNYCGLETTDAYGLIGSAILNFEPFGYGHDVLSKALWHLNKHFDGELWTNNGPDVVTTIVMQECNTTVIQDLLNCSSLKVYDPNILYPLPYQYHEKIFEHDLDNFVSEIKRTSFTIHLWNKLSHEYEIQVGSSQGYSLLAKEFCPDVYFNCGEIF